MKGQKSSTRNGIQPAPTGKHPTTPPNAFPCVPLCASTSAIRRRHAHNIFPHASSPSRQPHRATTIQPRRIQPSPSPPPFRPLIMPRLPISRGCLRLRDERGWRVCTPPRDDSTPMRFIRERVPEVRHDERPNADPGAAFSPSFDSSRVLEGHGLPGCRMWRAILSEVRFFFVHCLPLSQMFPHPSPALRVGGAFRIYHRLLARSLSRLSRTRSPSTRDYQHHDAPRSTETGLTAPRCLSVIRRLRCSCRSGSGSMSSPR